MKRLAHVLVLTMLASLSASVAGPCATNGGANAIDSGARGLGAGQWCELATNLEGGSGVELYDFFHTCGGNDPWTLVYSVSGSWDSVNHRLWWVGTPHGGVEGMVRYEAADNTWYAEDGAGYVAPLGTGLTCTPPAPWGNFAHTGYPGCSANHAYDTMGSFDGRYFYYSQFQSNRMRRFDTVTRTWNNNWSTIPSAGGAHTSAVAFWPEDNSLIALSGDLYAGGNEIWRYDFDTSSWSKFAITTYNYHTSIEYHPRAGEIWYQDGQGSTKSWRIWLNGGTPTITALPAAAVGLGATRTKCAADPASSDAKFVCWVCPEDQTGTTNSGWYEYNMTTRTWTSFQGLGISSAPPLWNGGGCAGDNLVTVVPEYGVILYAVTARGGTDQGTFIYKHTASGAPTVPPTPQQLRAQ
jgi:hypothetical protein